MRIDEQTINELMHSYRTIVHANMKMFVLFLDI